MHQDQKRKQRSKVKINPTFFLLFGIIVILLWGNTFPIQIKKLLYSISLTIREIIMFLMPLIIFALLSNSISKITSGKIQFILALCGSVIASNTIAAALGCTAGWFIGSEINLPFDIATHNNTQNTNSKILEPLWYFHIPTLIQNKFAMLLGITLGFIGSSNLKKQLKYIDATIELCNIFTSSILKYASLVIPPFILGLILKMQHEEMLEGILVTYSSIIPMIFAIQIAYILLLYLLASRMHLYICYLYLCNIGQAAITALTSMSGIIAIPHLLEGTKKSLQINLTKKFEQHNNNKNDTKDTKANDIKINSDLANSITPIIINSHFIGDCIGIPILTFITMKIFDMQFPNFALCTIFVLYMVVTRFSVASIPSAGIIISLPILEQLLGFNSDMLAIIAALYAVLDAFMTCINVIGNNAFSIIFIRLFKLYSSNTKNHHHI